MTRTARTPRTAPAPARTPDDLGTGAEVCAILRTSRSNLWRLTTDDPIMRRAVVRLGPGATRYRLPVIAEFQASRSGLRAAEPVAATASRSRPVHDGAPAVEPRR